MTLTLPRNSSEETEHAPAEVKAEVTRVRRQNRARRARKIRALAAQVQEGADGTRTFLRFNTGQRIEHLVLIASMGTLALTGLMQTFSELSVVGWLIRVFGSIDTLRVIHHLAATVMILQSIYHLQHMLVTWIIKREKGAMWPSWLDLRNMVQMVKYNLGIAEERPEFDRFTIEEKLEYWAMLWGTPVMMVTGLILWFPTIVTLVLPGTTVPVARAFHKWEAILATAAILTWHIYNVAIKEKNTSIFTGTMTEDEMIHSHPVEYRRILEAKEMVDRAKALKEAGKDSGELPVIVAAIPQNQRQSQRALHEGTLAE